MGRCRSRGEERASLLSLGRLWEYRDLGASQASPIKIHQLSRDLGLQGQKTGPIEPSSLLIIASIAEACSRRARSGHCLLPPGWSSLVASKETEMPCAVRMQALTMAGRVGRGRRPALDARQRWRPLPAGTDRPARAGYGSHGVRRPGGQD